MMTQNIISEHIRGRSFLWTSGRFERRPRCGRQRRRWEEETGFPRSVDRSQSERQDSHGRRDQRASRHYHVWGECIVRALLHCEIIYRYDHRRACCPRRDTTQLRPPPVSFCVWWDADRTFRRKLFKNSMRFLATATDPRLSRTRSRWNTLSVASWRLSECIRLYRLSRVKSTTTWNLVSSFSGF